MKTMKGLVLIWLLAAIGIIACGGGSASNSMIAESAVKTKPPAYAGIALHRLYGFTTYNHITEADFKYFVSIKVRSVRIMLMDGDLLPLDVLPEEAASARISQENLDKIIRILDWGEAYGITIILDLHEALGLRRWTGLIDFRMWQEDEIGRLCRLGVVNIWRQLAEICQDRPANMVVFELMNEPEPKTEDDPREDRAYLWEDLQDELILAIREIDQVHTIMASPAYSWRVDSFDDFVPSNIVLFDGKILLAAHFYHPHKYTHQDEAWAGAVEYLSYPGVIDGVYWNFYMMRETLGPLRNFQLEYPNLPIAITEFSTIKTAPGASWWLDDAISLFQNLGLPWFYHVYDEKTYFTLRGIKYGEEKYNLEGDNAEVVFDALAALP